MQWPSKSIGYFLPLLGHLELDLLYLYTIFLLILINNIKIQKWLLHLLSINILIA